MRLKLISFFLLAFLMHSLQSVSQVVLQGAPGKTKWKQINTDHFKVIFPTNFHGEAQRMANTLESLYLPASISLKKQPKKTSIILQNQNAIANGFVAWAPLRSEFFTMSTQDYNFLGVNNWLDLLATHEFRHVVQNYKGMVGFNKLVYWVLGEFALSGMQFISVPNWFDEGDAVVIETALTPTGRGRIPVFNMATRARYLETGAYNYHKQFLGSFKDFVPSHYVIGYHMTAYLRGKTGTNTWEPIIQDAYKNSFVPFNFSNSIKRNTGNYVVELYDNMADSLTELWSNQLEDLPLSTFERVNQRPSLVFTDYLYPQVLNDGSVIALKRGLSDISKFIRIHPDGTTSKIFVPGFVNDPGFLSANDHYIVWTEYNSDPRWAKRTYSVVSTYNLKTRRFHVITRRSRFSGASISPDGTKIVVVDNLPDGKYQLKILSANMGTVLGVLAESSSAFYSHPSWSEDSEEVVVMKTENFQKTVVRINPGSGAEEILTEPSAENIGRPVLHDRFLFYNSPVSGIDNIYAKDLSTGEVWQVTSSKYGAFNPSFSSDGKTMLYNDFTADGMDVVTTSFLPSSWIKIKDVENRRVEFWKPSVEQEGNPDVLKNVPTIQHPIAPYPRGKQLFNVHSWGPYFSTSALDYDIGIEFQDILSINRGFLGYELNADDWTGKWKANYSYQGFYPIIDLEISRGNRKASASTLMFTDSTVTGQRVDLSWEEKSLQVGLRIPLSIRNSKYQIGFSVANYLGYNEVFKVTSEYSLVDKVYYTPQSEGILINNEFQLSFFGLLKTSKRDIQSRWGLASFLTGLSTPYGGDLDASSFAISNYVFIPGLFRHHSTNFLFAYQNRRLTFDSDNYWFPNLIPFPRGYGSSVWEDFFTFRANYEFTLWNADLALGPFLNIQRIRTKVFYDYGRGSTNIVNNNLGIQLIDDSAFDSYGNELWFDFNFMRLNYLLSMGIRYVYLPSVGPSVELVIGNIGI